MRQKKIISVMVIVTILMMSGIGSFAQGIFSDVADSHWGKQYIEKMADKGIINGYYDDKTLKFSFKPNDAVTKVQSIKMIYESLKAAGKLQSTTGLVKKHEAVLNGNAIPSWAHEAVAYGLEYQIIHPDELKTFMKNNVQANARRVDVAVFLGKALNMPNELDPWPILSYVDAEMIIDSAERYVHLLQKKGIMNGDENNYFNPNNTITRAQLAKMCSVTYDLLNDGKPVTPIEPEYTVKERTIDYVSDDTDTIIVKNEDGKSEIYKIDSDVVITVNGVKKSISSLKNGQKVKLSFNDEDELVSVEVDNTVSAFEGTISSVVEFDEYYLLTVKNKDDSSDKRTFRIYDDAMIKIDGKTKAAQDLKTGDAVQLKVDGENATEIIVKSKTQVYYGILESGVVFKEKPLILIRLNNQEILELELDDDVDVEKNGKDVAITQLIKGDVVTVTTEYDLVVEIVTTSIKGDEEGVIKAITIGNPSKITILNDDNEENTYEISNNADIEIDNEEATLYDLRVNYRVEVKFEGNTITDIEAESIEEKNQFTGEIVKVYEDYDVVSIKYINPITAKYETKSITVSKNTKIISISGRTIDLDDLDPGDKVFVDGTHDGDIFVADRIIILN